MLTTFRRLIKFGWSGFARNKEASVVTIFVMTLAVFLISGWLMFNGLSQALINEVSSQMGISAYFQRGTNEEQINQVDEQLRESFPEAIEATQYVSPAAALEEFKKRHGGEGLYQKALEEAGPDAIRPALDITAYQENQYREITDYLGESFPSLIYQVDYLNRQEVINKAFYLMRKLDYFSLIAGLVLICLVILVVFNTIRLAIYSTREEMETMKLVGASNWFAWCPFVVQGAIYGLAGFLAANIIFIPLLFWLTPHLSLILPSFNLGVYYQAHCLFIIAVQLGASLGLGMASTFLATRYYLKV